MQDMSFESKNAKKSTKLKELTIPAWIEYKLDTKIQIQNSSKLKIQNHFEQMTREIPEWSQSDPIKNAMS